jgi:mRNA-degrading endonuclease RelE of RelBE toxin-antitoxin system
VAYVIGFSPDVKEHLLALGKRDRVTVLDAIEEQLTHEPTRETRQRKPMRPNPLAPWELRVGRFRVYYDVQDAPETVVTVLAVGVKERSRVRIGREEVTL